MPHRRQLWKRGVPHQETGLLPTWGLLQRVYCLLLLTPGSGLHPAPPLPSVVLTQPASSILPCLGTA